MSNIEHKYIALAYELFAIENNEQHLIEKTTAEKPFGFISGFGLMLDDFEKQTEPLNMGDEFDFTLSVEQAFGNYDEKRVVNIDRKDFMQEDGRFDYEHIFKDATIPLQNEEGDRFWGTVLEVNDNAVVIDLNHPLAGKQLRYKGVVTESRLATEHEVHHLIKMLSGGCGGCGSCGGCGNEEEEDGDCCGKHGEGDCCGRHGEGCHNH